LTDGIANLVGRHLVGPVCLSRSALGGSQLALPLRMIRRIQQVAGHLGVDFGTELDGPGKVFGPLPQPVEQLGPPVSQRCLLRTGLNLFLASAVLVLHSLGVPTVSGLERREAKAQVDDLGLRVERATRIELA
jgi:hypothetical protein